VIKPTSDAMVYNTNNDAIQALKAKQIDAIVVDLPTAFYITAAQLDNSVIVGQFPVVAGPDAEHFSLVLQKGSSLTQCVNQAIAALKADGTLDQITKTWLSDKASAPVFGQ
jgi:polar amino acid transport system substrate-binding protein